MSSRFQDTVKIVTAPEVTVNLMHRNVEGKDDFYSRVTAEFYREATRRHPKFPLIRRLQFGVALCVLPPCFDDYFMRVEAAARRNFKKAGRAGYGVQPIDFNRYLDDIGSIRASAVVRQGAMPSGYLGGSVRSCPNPPPLTPTHAYPYFGVVKEGKLVAYAGVLIAGEMAMIEHILGHADYQADGVVPMLIIDMANHLMSHYPSVKFYGYGGYFGAGETMRRFKRKFCFTPHRVKWLMG